MRISDWSSDVCSSDLAAAIGMEGNHQPAVRGADRLRIGIGIAPQHRARLGLVEHRGERPRGATPGQAFRSEEHTSELQSLMRNSYTVFCLKKKTDKTTTL